MSPRSTWAPARVPTAFAIGHAEQRPAARVVVIDTVMHWRPGKGAENRVDLTEVEATMLRVCREYGVARLRNDRMQAEQTKFAA